jgi:hypothetical protein
MWWKYYVFMCENGKMRPIETISRMGEESIKESDGGDKFNYDILVRILANVTMYPQYNNNNNNNNNNNEMIPCKFPSA